MTIQSRGRPARRETVGVERRHFGAALVDPSNGRVHLVNHTAAAIWELCDGETDPQEMIDAVCTLSGLPREVADEDVENILLEFDGAGLLAWAGE